MRSTPTNVVFTYNRSKDPEQSIHSGALTNVQAVEKIDDYTVPLHPSRRPQASFLVKTLERSYRPGDDHRQPRRAGVDGARATTA